MREVGGVLYINDGDWVESCTALVEHYDGRLELIDWLSRNRLTLFSSDGRISHADALVPAVLGRCHLSDDGAEPSDQEPFASVTTTRITIVSDAWTPQVNGVVRTLSAVVEELRGMEHSVEVIGPDRFRTVPIADLPRHSDRAVPEGAADP